MTCNPQVTQSNNSEQLRDWKIQKYAAKIYMYQELSSHCDLENTVAKDSMLNSLPDAIKK